MLDWRQIPTHLGVQDRFCYGLSMAQLLALLLGGSAAWAAWQDQPTLPAGLRAGAAGCALLLTLAGALVRPAGRPLLDWALVLLRYAATPKRSVWRPRAPAWATSPPGGPDFAPLAPRPAWALPPGEVRR